MRWRWASTKLRSLSINTKLLVINLMVSASAMLVMFVFLTAYIFHLTRGLNADAMDTYAAMLADNCKAALSFGDPEEAAVILGSLSQNSAVVGARLFDERGKPFAAYVREPEGRPVVPMVPRAPGQTGSGELLITSRKVNLAELEIGQLILVSEDSNAHLLVRRAAWIFLVAFSIALVPATLLSMILKRSIAEPVLRMADTAKAIKRDADYSPRVEWWSGDELGVCTEAFNDMLAQIQVRTNEADRLRELLQNIIDSMPSAILCTDRDGVITWCNATAERITNQKGLADRAHTLEDALPHIEASMETVRRVIESRLPQKLSKVRKSAQRGFDDVTVYPLSPGHESSAVIRIDDVTDRVAMEELMIQSEKMLSVGGLAAGMAHEINNPLAGIIQNVQVLRNRLDPKLPRNQSVAADCETDMARIEAYVTKRGIRVMIEAISESGKRAAKIVENMLSFSRKGDSRMVPHNLADLLDRTLELAANDYDLRKRYDFRQIEVLRLYDSGMPAVPCEGSQVQQVFLNLLKNGAAAMAGRNSERIELGLEPVTPRFVLRIEREGGHAVVEIADNGPGMDEETRKRAFEPFFTTKGVGEGTGLGLSVSYFIITENHGGTMEIVSAPERGARFIIRLPSSRA